MGIAATLPAAKKKAQGVNFLPDPLLKTRQAAKLLGVVPDTLVQWRCTRRYPLPYIMVGSSVRYRLSDVLAFIDRGSVDGLSRPGPHLHQRPGGPGRRPRKQTVQRGQAVSGRKAAAQ